MTSLKTSLLAAGTVALSMGIAHNVSANSTYQVKSGDTLSRIASANRTSVNALKNLNHISNINLIYPGQILQLSGGSSTPAKSTQSTTSSNNRVYVVKSGDTASAVAAKNGISLSQLQNFNHLANINLIYVGQKLIVGSGATTQSNNQTQSKPATTTTNTTASSSSTYRVVSGDTMSAIASRHGMSLTALLNLNNMRASQIIYVGQTIKVSGSQSTNTNNQASQQSSTSQNTNKQTITGSYTVKSGDTLYHIASQTGTSINTLLSVNGLQLTSIIYPGQVLKLSGTTQSNSSNNNSNNNNNSSANNSGTIKYIAAADTNHDGFMTMAEYNAYMSSHQNSGSNTDNSASGIINNMSNGNTSSTNVGAISTAGLSATQAAWLRNAAIDAKNATAGTGVRASVTVAQAIIESGWGSSALASAPYNNLFGIKVSSGWYGSQVVMRTGEYINGRYVTVNAAFRAYASQEASFRDHTNFLLQNGRYAANGVINSGSYQAMANGLQAAGYATDPSYASTLISVVQRYNLSVLD